MERGRMGAPCTRLARRTRRGTAGRDLFAGFMAEGRESPPCWVLTDQGHRAPGEPRKRRARSHLRWAWLLAGRRPRTVACGRIRGGSATFAPGRDRPRWKRCAHAPGVVRWKQRRPGEEGRGVGSDVHGPTGARWNAACELLLVHRLLQRRVGSGCTVVSGSTPPN